MDDPFPPTMMTDIARFLENDADRPVGEDIYPEVFLTGTFFPLQRQRELVEMIKVAREYSPKVVYEIGADKGGGLFHWCKCIQTVSRVIACEIRGTPYWSLFEKAFPHIDFLWLEGSSYDPTNVEKIREWLKDDKLDVVFIDGDKSEFETDFDVVLPMMSDQSVIFMHDITDPAPGAAFDRVCQRKVGRYRRIVDRRDSMEAMQREKDGIPSTGSHEGWLRHWKGASCGVGVIKL